MIGRDTTWDRWRPEGETMRADARANRADLVAAARRLYSVSGGDVPFRAIAAEAGVGIGTLYRHFPTRHELVIGVAQQVLAEVEAAVRRCETGWDDDPATAWTQLAGDLAAIGITSFAPQLISGDDVEPLWQETEFARRGAIELLERIVERARAAHFIAEGVTAVQFHVGVARVTRPLPDYAERLDPGGREWLLRVYLDGLRMTATRPVTDDEL